MSTLLQFNNVKEIIFKKITENTYSININSDIRTLSNDNILKSADFKADICTINPILTLNTQEETSEFLLPNGKIISSKSCNIPMEINLLANAEDKKIFEILANTKEYLGIYDIPQIECFYYKILAVDYEEAKNKFLNKLLENENISKLEFKEIIRNGSEFLNIIPLFNIDVIE